MNASSIPLLNNASASGGAFPWDGGSGHFSCVGTYGGTSAQLEYQVGSAWVPAQALAPDGTLTAVPLTANGGFVVDLPPTNVRVILTGGAPSAMYSFLARIPS